MITVRVIIQNKCSNVKLRGVHSVSGCSGDYRVLVGKAPTTCGKKGTYHMGETVLAVILDAVLGEGL